jgi:hypothetical protein
LQQHARELALVKRDLAKQQLDFDAMCKQRMGNAQYDELKEKLQSKQNESVL